MLKFRRETSIGYESRKCTQADQGGLLGGHIRALQSKTQQTYAMPPSIQLPIYNFRSDGQLARLLHENGQPLTTHSVRNHSLSGPASASKRVTACYKPGQATRLVGSKVYVWNVFDWRCRVWSLFLCSVYKEKDISPQSNIYLDVVSFCVYTVK